MLQDGIRVIKLCQSVLSVSLSDLDPAKNASTALCKHPLLLHKLVDRMESVLCSLVQRLPPVTESQVTTHLIPTLSLLLGLGAPYRMRYAPDIHASFQSIRHVLLDDCGSRRGFFPRVTAVLSKRADLRFLKAGMDENDVSRGIVVTSKLAGRSPEGCLEDLLLHICVAVVEVDPAPALIAARAGRLVRDLLTVPMLTCLLSATTISTNLATRTLLEHVTGTLSNLSQLALPASPVPVFRSGQWLLGNLCSLGPFLPLLAPLQPTREAEAKGERTAVEVISDPLLVKYFNLLSSLLVKWDVPGVWAGKCSVIWERDGAVLQASAVPKALQQQIVSLMDPEFLRALYMRCVRPFPFPLATTGASEEKGQRRSSLPPLLRPLQPCPDDVTEVRQALSSTGLKLVRDTLKDQQDSSTLLGGGSKWASKIMASIRGVFGGGQSSRAPSAQEAFDAARSSRLAATAEAENSGRGDDEAASLFPPNEEVVLSLCRLWGLIFPHAASAPHESACWKGLSSLAFSTRALGRLWGVAVCAVTRGQRPSAPLSFAPDGGDFSTARDLCPGVGGGLAALVNVAAVIKIVAIALDDAELYDQGVSATLSHVTR